MIDSIEGNGTKLVRCRWFQISKRNGNCSGDVSGTKKNQMVQGCDARPFPSPSTVTTMVDYVPEDQLKSLRIRAISISTTVYNKFRRYPAKRASAIATEMLGKK
jgi:hypothetical protein